MDGISRGVRVGERYSLQRALSSRAGVEQWIAEDGTLGREVTVTCFAADHPHASAALDSARRLAGVEDRRLGQVLDVGTETDPAISYVVTEATHHAESVASLLRADRLPAEEVRRLIGEAAVALETARQRGLHHRILTPHHVLRSPDGTVHVSGVAVGAALAGRDDEDGDAASREDVVALVSVAYAGLTGQWPGPDEVPGVDLETRRADGQLPSPSERVNKVPGDLDTLCRTVLVDDEGPRTPGELARQLSPWSAERVHGAGGRDPQTGGRDPQTAAKQQDRRRLATGAAGMAATPAALAAPGAIGRTDDDVTDPGSIGHDDPTVIGRRPALDDDETSTFAATRIPEDDDPYIEQDLEPPLPLLSHGTAEPDRNSSRLALSIVAGIVVAALVLGFLGLRGLFQPGDDSEDVADSPSATSTGTSSSSTPSTTRAPAPVKVASVSSIDPQGDGDERNDLASKAIDGDPQSVWTTHRYLRDTFTRTGKQGAGLLLNLGKATEVARVRVTVDGSPISATVYVADQARMQGARSLGSFTGSGNQQVAPKARQSGQYVIVWVTKLGEESPERFRARIGEVQVLS